MENFKNYRKYLFISLFVIAGGLAGYAYWYYIGCNSGTCPITAKWQTSSIYGLIFGYFIGDSVIGKKSVKTDKINR